MNNSQRHWWWIFFGILGFHLILMADAESLHWKRMQPGAGDDLSGFFHARTLAMAVKDAKREHEPDSFLDRLEARLQERDFLSEARPTSIYMRAMWNAVMMQDSWPPSMNDTTPAVFAGFRAEFILYEGILFLSAFLAYRLMVATQLPQLGFILAILLMLSSFTLFFVIWKVSILPGLLFLILALAAWKKWVYAGVQNSYRKIFGVGMLFGLMVLTYPRSAVGVPLIIVSDWLVERWKVPAEKRIISMKMIFICAIGTIMVPVLHDVIIWSLFKEPSFMVAGCAACSPTEYHSWLFFYDNFLYTHYWTSIKSGNNAIPGFFVRIISYIDGFVMMGLMVAGVAFAFLQLIRLSGQAVVDRLQLVVVGWWMTVVVGGLGGVLFYEILGISKIWAFYYSPHIYYLPFYLCLLVGISMLLDYGLRAGGYRRHVAIAVFTVTVFFGLTKNADLYYEHAMLAIACENYSCSKRLHPYWILEANRRPIRRLLSVFDVSEK